MIRLSNTGDRMDRKQVEIDQTTQDGNSRFIISLITADLPPNFENSLNRSVDISVIEHGSWNDEDHPNSLMVPLVLTSISQIEGKIKYYYTQKFDGQSSQLSNQIRIDGYVVRDSLEGDDIETPYLVLSFGVLEQNQNASQIDGSRQQFTGSGQDQGYDSRRMMTREHVDAGENSNGGLDLPIGEHKNDQAEEHRERQAEENVKDLEYVRQSA